ncbi:hypothetical protein J416_07102 [Gracilibacillus halophilus YIM-C55.5]|uniref:DUF6884 domain-containing protein n=1 Tax=Gracilibacillus halophilus YIM-C55.5 TaxID=1308866 RepID=N4WS24_9BACI|nr:DUF6884 domain-containing protein [Gracilibacillus halophilus]ENH97190.1 hypothetical protein J416_07102 [Gracilibacillus halophilus YIM-C55.5]
MHTLCIIPCGRKKIWDKYSYQGPTEAKDAYIGVLHRLCRQYVRMHDLDWVILSAKYGLLCPEDVVWGNYDVSFHDKKSKIIPMHTMKQQKQEKKLARYKNIIVLAGKKYQPIVNELFSEAHRIQYPLLGTKGIGDMQSRLKSAIETGHVIHK